MRKHKFIGKDVVVLRDNLHNSDDYLHFRKIGTKGVVQRYDTDYFVVVAMPGGDSICVREDSLTLLHRSQRNEVGSTRT
ncbi:MAG: hypothetical protein KBE65_04240 [Phycisphaerae bacterium]|nr:hypothetical protein [Phycisphaerae bacterium]